MTKLRIALIATFRPLFQGDMKGVLKASIENIASLSKELDFDFIPLKKEWKQLRMPLQLKSSWII